jgi:carbamoyl-phosphate synthase large subunit
MNYKVLLEASGSLTSHYMIKAIKDAGGKVVCSDIKECAASYLSDEFIIFPKSNHPDLWQIIESEIIKRGINVVIPSFDETLFAWSEKKEYFAKKGVHVIISDSSSLAICQDKWETFKFFKNTGIPTPETSLQNEFTLVKPRLGRGGKGIVVNPTHNQDMNGMISQELIIGEEFTVDIFCDQKHTPIYIIPRKRLDVADGKSLGGITVFNEEIIHLVKKICVELKFIGPVNIQCFVTKKNEIFFIEINPRIAGGMALGFTSSENWVNLIFRNIIEQKTIHTLPIKFGLKMFRIYNEVFA